MEEISLELSKRILGGGSVSGALITAIRGYVMAIFSVGQAVGGAIRRVASRNLCSF